MNEDNDYERRGEAIFAEMTPLQAKEYELIGEVLISTMLGEIEMAGTLFEQLEQVQLDCLPPEGRYRLAFAGKPRRMDVETICFDCGQAVATDGIAFMPEGEFGKTDEEFVLLMHQSGTCSHWKWRLRRLYYRYIGTPIARYRHRHYYPPRGH